MLLSHLRSGLCVAVLGLAASPLAADPFADLAEGFAGRLGASGPDRGAVVAGQTAFVSGRGLTAGQTVVLRQGGDALTEALTVDDKGGLSAEIAIPAGTAPGVYPVVVEMENPAYATIFDLKVSPKLDLIGEYDVQRHQLLRGLYQVAISEGQNAAYVTAAVGRPPVKESALMKLDLDTLEIVAEGKPAPAPARADGSDGGVYAVYGVGVAEEAGQVWVTNTRQNTVAVYDADDLSLIKQFDADTVPHPRDAVVYDGKVYVSATFEPLIHVFDTTTLEELAPIELTSGKRRETFGTASLQLDAEAGSLFVVSLTSNEVAEVDLAEGAQTHVWTVPHSDSTIGVGHDPKRGLIFTAGQGNDVITILNDQTGEVVKEVRVGANPLNIVFDPVADVAYVALRGSGTLVAVSPEGEVVGNVEIGPLPNHLALDGKGGVLVVNKGNDDPTANNITRVTPKG